MILIVFLIVVIVILLSVFIYTGVLNLNPQGSSGHVRVVGFIKLPGLSAGSGDLNMTVQNTGTLQVLAIVLSCPSSQFASSNCGGLAFSYHGQPVSPEKALPPGATAGGTSLVQSQLGSPFQFDTSYPITINVTYSDGSTSSDLLAILAQ